MRFQKLDLIFSSIKKASILTRLKISDVSSSAHTLTVKKHAKPIPRDYDTLLAIVIKLPSYMSWFGDLQPGLIIKWPGLRVKFRTVSDNYDRYCPIMVTRKGNKGRRKSYYIQHNELLTEIILQIQWWLFTIDSWIVLPVRHLGQHTQFFLTWWKRIYRRKGWIWVFLSRLYGWKDFWKIFQNWLLFEKLLHGSRSIGRRTSIVIGDGTNRNQATVVHISGFGLRFINPLITYELEI